MIWRIKINPFTVFKIKNNLNLHEAGNWIKNYIISAHANYLVHTDSLTEFKKCGHSLQWVDTVCYTTITTEIGNQYSA